MTWPHRFTRVLVPLGIHHVRSVEPGTGGTTRMHCTSMMAIVEWAIKQLEVPAEQLGSFEFEIYSRRTGTT